ncbi:MAG: phospholipid carrier-dependent glycosyltransferase [Thermoplasmatota archaeon]
MTPRQKKLFVLAVVVSLCIALRLYHIDQAFSTNGVDEGIHLLQAKMMAGGHGYYGMLEGDQPPLTLLTYALFNGAVVPCRLVSVGMFLGALAAVYYIGAWFNRNVAVVAVVLVSLDFMLLRESRLASLDMFSASLLCIGSCFFVAYEQRRRGWLAAGAGLFFSLALLSKLVPAFVVLFAVAVLLYWYREHWRHLLLFFAGLLLPALLLLLAYTPSELVHGMLLRQADRPFDLYGKWSLFLFLGMNFIYLSTFRRWNLRDRRVRYLLAWILLIVVPVMVQGMTAPHHFVYVSFPFAVLTAVVLVRGWNMRKKTLLAGFIAFALGISLFFTATAPPSLADDTADVIAEQTPDDALVVAGNPLVNVLADRSAPHNLTNVARFHYPPTTADKVLFWLNSSEVQAVVLYYHLANLPEVEQYLERNDGWHKQEVITGRGEFSFDGYTPGFSRDTYTIYLRRDGVT